MSGTITGSFASRIMDEWAKYPGRGLATVCIYQQYEHIILAFWIMTVKIPVRDLLNNRLPDGWSFWLNTTIDETFARMVATELADGLTGFHIDEIRFTFTREGHGWYFTFEKQDVQPPT